MTYDLYVDVLFFNNFTMDLILLLTLRKIMKLKKRRGGCLFASALGACYAVAVTIYPFSFALLQAVATYFLVSSAMLMIAFQVKGRKELVKALAGLYMSAALMNGLLDLLRLDGGLAWYVEQIIFGSGWRKIPFFVYVIAACGCFFMAVFLWETVRMTEHDNSHLYTVVIFYQGKNKSVTALLDTGNRLTEPYSHQPVSLVEKRSCEELFQTVESVLYIPFSSVGRREGVLPAVRADRMEIESGEKRVTVERPFIAISEENLSPNGTYQMLLNEKIMM